MDIVCFANDWDGDPLSKKHIMRGLALRGARVLWVNSLGNRSPRLGDPRDLARARRKLWRFCLSASRGPRPVEERIWVLDPLCAPAYGSRALSVMNAVLVGTHVRAATARLGLQNPVHYTFVPASAWVAGRLGESRLVYHAADEYAAFGGADREAILRLEATLLARADLFVGCSQPLLARKAHTCRRAMLLRHGVDHAHFARALNPTTSVAPELQRLRHPVVGFIGQLGEWIDLDLLLSVAEALAPQRGTLALVGEVRGADARRIAALGALQSVRLLGHRPYAEIPSFCRGFDVALVPFVHSELTWHANPLKLREYLAAGLPVVTTDFPEAHAVARTVHPKASGAVYVASDAADFVNATCRIASGPVAGPQVERSRAVLGETWEHKVSELWDVLESL